MYAYCLNNPVNTVDVSGHMAKDATKDRSSADGAALIPAALLCFFLLNAAENNDDNSHHHILHGSNKKHEDEWSRFGINPNDPDEDNWWKILPILEKAIEEGEEIIRDLGDTGEKLFFYVKEYVDEGVEVVVKIWESADGLVRKLSDAWGNIK